MPRFLIRFLLPSAACGLAVAWSIPPVDREILILPAVVGLLSLLWNLSGKRAGWKGFAAGYLAGAVSFGVQLSWLSVVSPIGAVVLPLYLALFWGAFGAFAATWGNPFRTARADSHIGMTFANAAVWAFLEWLRGWLFTGFGWNGLGVAFHDVPLLAQAADLIGVFGVSFLLVWFCGLIAAGLKVYGAPGGTRSGKSRGCWRNPAAAVVLAALTVFYGWIRIGQEHSRESFPLKALLVQINIPQEAARYLWEPERIHMAYEEDTLAALEEAKKAGEFPDWVVWPESALTGRTLRTAGGDWATWDENLHSMRNVREAGDFSLIYGGIELEAEADGEMLTRKAGGRTFNSLLHFSPEDDLQTFRKHHLVIFGETIPFVDSIPLLRKIYEQQAGVEYGGSFASGDSFEPLAGTAGGRAVGIIPTVCFEDSVPRLPRRFLRDGPQVLVNVTNDGWFKESPAADQHFANAKFRTIELRRPMIRCANTGVTAVVTSSGSEKKLTGPDGSPFIRGTMLETVAIPENPGKTLYGWIGDLGIILIGGIGMAMAVIFHRRVAAGSREFGENA